MGLLVERKPLTKFQLVCIRLGWTPVTQTTIVRSYSEWRLADPEFEYSMAPKGHRMSPAPAHMDRGVKREVERTRKSVKTKSREYICGQIFGSGKLSPTLKAA